MHFFLIALAFAPISVYISAPLLIISLIITIKNKKKLNINLLDKLQFALLLTLIISSSFAVYKGYSFLVSSLFLFYLISYFLSKIYFNEEKNIKKLINTLCLIIIIISIIGIVQHLLKLSIKFKNITILDYSGGRITSICYNPLILSTFLCFNLPLLLVYLFKNYKKILLYITIALSLITIYYTYSRGPTIALFFSIISLSILLRKKIIIITLSLAIFTLFTTPNPLRKRFISTLNPATDMSRKILIGPGIKMWKNNILTGVGIYNYNLLYENYSGKKKLTPYIHSIFLNFLVEAGILGATVLLLLFIFLLKYSFKIYKHNKYIGTVLLSSFIHLLILGLVDNPVYWVGLGIIFWCYMGIVSGNLSFD